MGREGLRDLDPTFELGIPDSLVGGPMRKVGATRKAQWPTCFEPWFTGSHKVHVPKQNSEGPKGIPMIPGPTLRQNFTDSASLPRGQGSVMDVGDVKLKIFVKAPHMNNASWNNHLT